MSSHTGTSLMTLIRTLMADPPKTVDALATQTGMTFEAVATGNTDAESGSTAALGAFESARIRKMDRAQDKSTMIVLTIAESAAPSQSEVKSQFGDMQITAIPRGRSPKEETQYTKVLDWGTAAFGFPDRAPDELRTVILRIEA
jgi:hypothetical protein